MGHLKASGRSVSQELEYRLERSFLVEDALFGDDGWLRLMLELARTYETTESDQSLGPTLGGEAAAVSPSALENAKELVRKGIQFGNEANAENGKKSK